jgi:hypothetical protein
VLPLPAAGPRPYQPAPMCAFSIPPSPPRPADRRLAAILWATVAVLPSGCEVRDEVGGVPSAARHVSGAARLLDRVPSSGPRQAAGATEPRVTPTVEFVEGYEAGVRRARTEARPMVLVFKAVWCRHSGMLLQRTLLDPRVVELSRRYVCVAIDADREPDVCRRYAVTAFPTLIVVDAAGRAGPPTVGRPSALDLLAGLEAGDRDDGPERIATGDDAVAR